MKKFRERWEAEETKVGKILKYYIGYVGIATGFITGVITDVTPMFMAAGIAIPTWITKALLLCGIVGYFCGKITKKSDDSKDGQSG